MDPAFLALEQDSMARVLGAAEAPGFRNVRRGDRRVEAMVGSLVGGPWRRGDRPVRSRIVSDGLRDLPTAATRSELPRRASIDFLGRDRAPDPNLSSPGQTEGPNVCPLAFTLPPDSQGWFGGSGPLAQSSILFDVTG